MTAPDLSYWGGIALGLGGGIVLVVILAALAVRGGRSPRVRRSIWQAALVGCGLLVSLELTGLASVARGVVRERVTGSAAATGDAIPNEPPDRIAAASVPGPGADSPLRAADSPLRTSDGPPAMTHGIAGRSASVDRTHGSPLEEDPRALPSAMPWADESARRTGLLGERSWLPGVVWGLVALAILGRSLVLRFGLAIRLMRCRETGSRTLRRRVHRTRERLGIRRPVRIVVWRELTSPVAFGVLRPTVGIPVDFEDSFTPAQQDAMLAHELAHVALADPFWHLAGDAIVALAWWHPLVRWVRRRHRYECECAADEASVVVDGGPAHLAESLVLLGSRLAGRPSPGLAGADGGAFRSGLGRRVERLMGLTGDRWGSRHSRSMVRLATWVAPAVLVAAGLAATSFARTESVERFDSRTRSGEQPMKIDTILRRSLMGFTLSALLGAPAPEAQATASPADGSALVTVASSAPTPPQVPAPCAEPREEPVESKGQLFLDALEIDAILQAVARQGGEGDAPTAEAEPFVPDEVVRRFHTVSDLMISGSGAPLQAAPDDPESLGARIVAPSPGEEPWTTITRPASSVDPVRARANVVVEARLIPLSPNVDLVVSGDVKLSMGPDSSAQSDPLVVIAKPDAATLRWADEAARRQEENRVYVVPVLGGESAQLTQIDQVAYISEYGVERSGTVTVADPVVSVVQTGLLLEVKPTPTASGIQLDVSVDMSNLDEMLEREIGLIAGAPPVTIQIPVVARRKTRAVETVAEAGRLLLILRMPADGGASEVVLVDLSARSVAPDDPVRVDTQRKGK